MGYYEVFLRTAARGPPPSDVHRVGLGVVILVAGAHKVAAPGVWSAYSASIVTALWPISMDATMVANGVIEVGFGLVLLADRHTAVAAAVVAISLLGVVANLALVAVVSGQFVDVLIRDLGLAALATGVTIAAAKETA